MEPMASSHNRSRHSSQELERSHRSRSPVYSRQNSVAPSEARSPREPTNGHYQRHSRSLTRSRSPSRNGRRDSERSPAGRGSPTGNAKIVVEKLTKNVNEEHLREIFGAYGRVRKVDLPMNRQFMTNRGTGFIIYDNIEEAESAIAHMHEAQLDGVVISVSIVLPRRKLSRSPPPSRRLQAHVDRYNDRGPPYQRGPPPGPPRYRSPPRRGRSPPPPPRRFPRPRRDRDNFDVYRPRSYSRSRSPPRRSPSPPRRRRSYSRSFSRSPSRGPPPRRRRDSPPLPPPRGSGGGRRRRSLSYSSYESHSGRSRSRSPGRRGGRRY